VLDGVKRLAMVETKTVDAGVPVGTPAPKQRYQLGNHLGSAMLELDEAGLIVSYEEYHPYGSSAYRSARSGVEVSARRYRYVGMERDDETGLYLMGARYYACWLGRWTSADPMGIGADGPGLYNYTRGSPVTLSDPSGHQTPRPASGADPIAPPPPEEKRDPSKDLDRVVNAVGNVVDRNNGELVPTPVAAPPGAEASASSGGSSGVLSPNAFVQGAKDRVKQKSWAGLEELPGALGTVFAAVHLYVNPEEKAAELSRPAEAPALDPFSQVIGAVKSAVNFFNADKETRSRAAGALTVDLLQQLAGALILGAAVKGAGGEPPEAGGGRGGNQFRGPDPEAGGLPHTRFRLDAKGVAHYETYDFPTPGVGKRVDVVGAPHGGVPTPHVVETVKHVNPRDPSKARFTEGAPRPATPDEIPRRLP